MATVVGVEVDHYVDIVVEHHFVEVASYYHFHRTCVLVFRYRIFAVKILFHCPSIPFIDKLSYCRSRDLIFVVLPLGDLRVSMLQDENTQTHLLGRDFQVAGQPLGYSVIWLS